MTTDSLTPVIVGIGQVKQHPEDPAHAVEAVELMIEAVRRAVADSGSSSLGRSLDQIAVVSGAWSYSDPARIIAARLDGDAPVHTILSGVGGQTPQSLVNLACRRIAAGQTEAVAITGAETIWSRRRMKRLGRKAPRTDQTDIEPDERTGDQKPMSSPFEDERGLSRPIDFYPIFESAVRAANGETIDEHRRRTAELWAGFNRVATTNPYAWSPTPMTADEIMTVSPANRMVGFPYTKAMNSNWDLDLGAAVIVCSAAKAGALGIDRDRWIFPWAGAEGNDTPFVTNRRDLHSSPAIAAIAAALGSMTGMDPSQADHVDLYSCFPSAVQIAAQAFDLDQSRTLTVTGGLPFAGGPLNNYVTHSIAAMVETLREAGDDATGLVTANGGFLTKHAATIYGRRPPTGGFRWQSVQDEVDRVPSTEADGDHTGPATVEAYTVMHDKDGPSIGLFALRTPVGGRSWGYSDDHTTMNEIMDREAVGRPAVLSSDGRVGLDERR